MKFASNNKNQDPEEFVAPSIVAKSMTIVGDMACTGNIKIDGHVIGNVCTSGRLIIGQAGKIRGSVRATNIIVEGKFEGRLECAGTLSIKMPASVNGEIYYDKIEIDHGVELSGELGRLDIQKIQHTITEKSESLMRKMEDHFQLQVIKHSDNYKELPVSKTSKESDGEQSTIENIGWG